VRDRGGAGEEKPESKRLWERKGGKTRKKLLLRGERTRKGFGEKGHEERSEEITIDN